MAVLLPLSSVGVPGAEGARTPAWSLQLARVWGSSLEPTDLGNLVLVAWQVSPPLL